VPQEAAFRAWLYLVLYFSWKIDGNDHFALERAVKR
jgi:hypothetical protein